MFRRNQIRKPIYRNQSGQVIIEALALFTFLTVLILFMNKSAQFFKERNAKYEKIQYRKH